jgi:predicted nucleic acid-binding protein
MIHVSLDTSFLISFADPKRPHHQVAVDYFKHCVASGFPMWVSTVVAGEFQVGQPFTDLPLQHFRIQPYNLPHALRAGELLKLLNSQGSFPRTDPRKVVINDVKIIAQAIEDRILIILSEDESTLARLAQRARRNGGDVVHVFLLSRGFTPGRLINPEQDEISFPSSS